MVLKLVESGGFVGRSKTAELDTHSLSADEQEAIKDFLMMHAGDQRTSTSGSSRDQFQYFIEFEGKRISLPQISSADKVVTSVFEKLMNDLHY